MPEAKAPRTPVGSVFRFSLAMALWFTLFLVLIAIVPSQRRFFDSYGLQLPTLTRIVIELSLWMDDYWWVMALFAIPALGVAAGGTFFVRHRWTNRWLMAAWTLLLILPPLAGHIIIFVSLWMARQKLIEGLQQSALRF